jgi:hypothetical protein
MRWGGYGKRDLGYQRYHLLFVYRRGCVSSGSQPVFLPRAGTSRLLAILRSDVCRAGSRNFGVRPRFLCGETPNPVGEHGSASDADNYDESGRSSFENNLGRRRIEVIGRAFSNKCVVTLFHKVNLGTTWGLFESENFVDCPAS